MNSVSNSSAIRAAQGQSLVETAFLLPLLLLLLLGTIDLGRAYFAYVGITNAAREGARVGMDDPTASGDCSTPKTIRGAVCQELEGSRISLPDPANDITIECSAYSIESFSAATCLSVPSGGRIRVTVRYDFNFLTTQVLGLSSMTLQNWATMAITNGTQ